MSDNMKLLKLEKLGKTLGLSIRQIFAGIRQHGYDGFLTILESKVKREKWLMGYKQNSANEFKELLSSLSEMEITPDEFDQMASAWADFSEAFIHQENSQKSGRFWKSAAKSRGRKAKSENGMKHFFGQPQQTKTQQEHFFGGKKS